MLAVRKAQEEVLPRTKEEAYKQCSKKFRSSN
jgi:hypothetical protein